MSESWLYKWRDRPPTPRRERLAELVERIGKLFAESGGTYGSPRIWLDLRAEGWRVSARSSWPSKGWSPGFAGAVTA